jgi:hypothetical protein
VISARSLGLLRQRADLVVGGEPRQAREELPAGRALPPAEEDDRGPPLVAARRAHRRAAEPRVDRRRHGVGDGQQVVRGDRPGERLVAGPGVGPAQEAAQRQLELAGVPEPPQRQGPRPVALEGLEDEARRQPRLRRRRQGLEAVDRVGLVRQPDQGGQTSDRGRLAERRQASRSPTRIRTQPSADPPRRTVSRRGRSIAAAGVDRSAERQVSVPRRT